MQDDGAHYRKPRAENDHEHGPAIVWSLGRFGVHPGRAPEGSIQSHLRGGGECKSVLFPRRPASRSSNGETPVCRNSA